MLRIILDEPRADGAPDLPRDVVVERGEDEELVRVGKVEELSLALRWSWSGHVGEEDRIGWGREGCRGESGCGMFGVDFDFEVVVVVVWDRNNTVTVRAVQMLMVLLLVLEMLQTFEMLEVLTPFGGFVQFRLGQGGSRWGR
jgi:hypothetical protein